MLVFVQHNREHIAVPLKRQGQVAEREQTQSIGTDLGQSLIVYVERVAFSHTLYHRYYNTVLCRRTSHLQRVQPVLAVLEQRQQ